MFKRSSFGKSLPVFALYFFISSCQSSQKTSDNIPKREKNNVILFIWDGLRPDVLTDPKAKTYIPNLLSIAKNGVEFQNNHSAYPTFTMNNAQVFATGSYPGTTGFYGNVLYEPWRSFNSDKYGSVSNSKGKDITSSFLSPIFTQDYKILQALHKPEFDRPLIQVTTLFEQAHSNGMITAVVGKSGPAFIQDYKSGGFILDEHHVWPLAFAKELQDKNINLPKLSQNAFSSGELKLAAHNGDPTASSPMIYLDNENNGTDPKNAKNSPFNDKNEYMANIFINNILSEKKPQLSVLWLRNPDSTEHEYGPGSLAYYNSLASNDKILGELREKLNELGIAQKTNIIIASDHSHSNITATKRNDNEGYPQLMYPLHNIIGNDTNKGIIGESTNAEKQIDNRTNEKILITNGTPVSGTVRTADLITKAKLKLPNGNLIGAYDGGSCSYNTSMSGIRKSNGSLNTNSPGYNLPDGKCLNNDKKSLAYTSPSYFVPKDLSNIDNIEKIIIAPNGGSDYIYIPSHNQNIINALVTFFQRRQEYSAIFIDDLRYSENLELPKGTFPLSSIKLANKSGRNPDIVVSLTSNPNVIVNGLSGTEFNSSDGDWIRGDHGSFSKIDVHNTLLAIGPDFNNGTTIKVPTGNVDVAPTIAKILGLNLPQTDGRPLLESLKNSGITQEDIKIIKKTVQSSIACDLEIYDPTTHPIDFSTQTKNKYIDHGVNSFYSELNSQIVTLKDGTQYVYFDSAEGKRQKGCFKN